MSSGPSVHDRLPPLQHDLLLRSLAEERQERIAHQVLFNHPHQFSPRLFLSAWAGLAQRHAILRTAFRRVRPGMLAAHVEDWISPAVSRYDVPGKGGSAWDRIDAVRAEDLARRFQPDRAPLWRVTVFAGFDETTPILFTYHPALLDERSRLQVIDGFLHEYGRQLAGTDPSDSTAPRPADFLGWLAQRDSAADEAFWRRTLADNVQPTSLSDRRADGRETSGGGFATRVTTLSSEGGAALDGLASQAGVPPDTIVEAAWALVLSRHTAAERVKFGLRFAPRPPQLAGADGFLGVMDRLAIAVHRVPVEQSVRTWLQHLSARGLEALDHAWAPQAHLAEWATPGDEGNLFETLLSLDLDAAVGEQRGALAKRVGASVLDAHEPAGLPLVLIVRREPEVVLRLTYDPTSIAASTADRLLRNVRAAIAEMASRPDAPLVAVTLMDAQERTIRAAVA